MNDQRQLFPVGSTVMTHARCVGVSVDGMKYGSLQPGQKGRVIGHTEDGRAIIDLGDGATHTFHDPAWLVRLDVDELSALRAERDALRRQLAEAQAENQRLISAGLDAAFDASIKAEDANDYYALVERLEAENATLRRHMESYKVGVEHMADEIDSLRRQLEEAQATEPDWGKAPAWAEWWAVDSNGHEWWYEQKPSMLLATWTSYDGEAAEVQSKRLDWYSTLTQRPGERVTV